MDKSIKIIFSICLYPLFMFSGNTEDQIFKEEMGKFDEPTTLMKDSILIWTPSAVYILVDNHVYNISFNEKFHNEDCDCEYKWWEKD